jgi:hypothetical protein
VCSNQFLEQIGGADGHRLFVLTVTQLLDLVSWVEHFREIIEKAFPDIGSQSYFDQRPKLLLENTNQVDLDVAKDSLAWVNSLLWQVHDLAKDEFLLRTKDQTDEWLDNVYEYVATNQGMIHSSTKLNTISHVACTPPLVQHT